MFVPSAVYTAAAHIFELILHTKAFLLSNILATFITILAGYYLWFSYTSSPPKSFAHLPSVPLYRFIWSQLLGHDYDKQEAIIKPYVRGSPAYRVYAFGTWTIIVQTPELAQKLLTNHRAVNKIEFFREFPHLAFSKIMGRNLVTLATGDEWRAHRQLSNPPFKRSFDLTIFGNSTLELFKIIERDQAASPDGIRVVIHMNTYMQQLTLDILGKTLFGYDFQALTKPGSDMVDRYNSILRQMFNPFYFIFSWIERVFPRRKLIQEATQFVDDIMEVVSKKRAELDELRSQGKFDEAETHMDLIQHLILGTEDKVDAQGNVVEKAVMDMESLRSSFFIYTLAGHDTTSNALSSALFLIAQHQNVQDKVRAEADAVLGGTDLDTIPTHEDLKQMPYLTAVIKEVSRLYPPPGQIGSRVMTEEMELMPGLVVPKGTNMAIQVRSIHLSQEVWGPDSLEFKPERFLENDGVSPAKIAASAWLPFGAGVRQCIGINMSLLEQKVVLAMMVRRYKMRLPSPDCKPKINGRGFLVISNADIIFEPHNTANHT